MKVLVINCGSSSLKLRLIDVDRSRDAVLAEGAVERIGPSASLVLCETGAAPVWREEPFTDWPTALRQLGEDAPTIQEWVWPS